MEPLGALEAPPTEEDTSAIALYRTRNICCCLMRAGAGRDDSQVGVAKPAEMKERKICCVVQAVPFLAPLFDSFGAIVEMGGVVEEKAGEADEVEDVRRGFASSCVG